MQLSLFVRGVFQIELTWCKSLFSLFLYLFLLWFYSFSPLIYSIYPWLFCRSSSYLSLSALHIPPLHSSSLLCSLIILFSLNCINSLISKRSCMVLEALQRLKKDTAPPTVCVCVWMVGEESKQEEEEREIEQLQWSRKAWHWLCVMEL